LGTVAIETVKAAPTRRGQRDREFADMEC